MNDTYPQADEPPDEPAPTPVAPAKGSSAFQVFSILLLMAAVRASRRDCSPAKWNAGPVAPKDENLIQDLDELGAMGYEIGAARRATSDDPDKKAVYR